MKKIFTLIAAALLSSGAFAQSEWQNLVVNGNMEGEQDPNWSSFWCHDYRQGLEFTEESNQRYDAGGQFQGFAEIVEDPTNPGNHCAKVIIRSDEEAIAAENRVEADGKLASWDCQFFVFATDTIPVGKELRMTLRVRAEKSGMFETQAHWTPGDYNHYQLFGNVNYTTEWQKIEVTATIGESHTGASNDKRMQSVAFNLSTMTDGNVIYFDDVKLEMRDPKGPEEFTGWFNMLRHGTLSADKIGNRTNFTGRDGIDGVDRAARIVADEIDGEPALNVTSIGWNAQKVNKVLVVDDDGNPVLDEKGDSTYTEEYVDIYIKENGDTLTNIDNWQTQFFVTGPHKFATGSKYKLTMWARADKPATIETQAHRMPGDYIHWQLLGNLDLTTEWQQFEFPDQEVTSDQSGSGSFQTIAFNCNVPKEVVNYYFRFEEFSANAADVTEDERTLDSESIFLPVPGADNKDGAKASIDFTKCMEVLEATSFENLINENMSVQKGEEEFGAVDASAGFFLTNTGMLSDDETGLIVEMDEVSDSDPTLNLTVYNDGEGLGENTLDTKMRFSFNKWFYVFNVTLVSEESYNGVSEITMQPAAQRAAYDLMGRRVQQPVKGLYIINGKKYLVK